MLDAYPTVDGQRAADVYLKGVELPAVSRLGPEGSALAAVEAALDIGLAALCADAVGVMQAMVDATVEYVRVRQQFGQPIGRFQALQHRIADMLIHLEQARSMSYLAALRCTAQDVARTPQGAVGGQGGDRPGRPIRRAAVGAAARRHGHDRRTQDQPLVQAATAAQIMFGDSDTHLQRYAALSRA